MFAIESSKPAGSITRTLTLMATGGFYWLGAALIIRWTAANWVGDTAMTLIVFALIIVATGPALFLGMRAARVGRSSAAYAAAIMTMTALLLDGVALTWFTSLYGTDSKIVLGGAAAILFGAGVALALGMLMQKD